MVVKTGEGEGLWQEIMRKKYVKNSCVAHLKHKPSNSSVWNDLLKVKDLYLKGRIMMVGDGKKNTDFWKDAWCGAIPLQEKVPELFSTCTDKDKTVAELGQGGWRLTFRRWLDENNQNQLRRLRDLVGAFALPADSDIPKQMELGWKECVYCEVHVCSPL